MPAANFSPTTTHTHYLGSESCYQYVDQELSEAERKDLLVQKLTQCTTVFDFQNPNESLEGKEAKQHTLTEILDYISVCTGVITLDIYPKLFKMVSANLFRTIPPQINAFGDPFDPEEDEPREEPAWPHLCLVYHIFLRFLESGDFNNSAARPYIDQAFTTQLLELFDSEDARERESLKTVLHRIYGKMLGMRSPKEVMFVNELEGIMDVIEAAQFTAVCQPLFQQLVKCIVSPHFQIAERTLTMWRNNYFVSLITDNIQLILPIALSGIYRHSRSHWNRNIHNQVYQILRFFVNVDEVLFEQCLADFRRQRDLERRRSKKNIGWWIAIEKLAIENTTNRSSSQPIDATPFAQAPAPASSLSEEPKSQGADNGEKQSPAAPSRADNDPDSNVPLNGVSVNGSSGDSDESAAAGPWSEQAENLPVSKLDDPETMCCEMGEDEFIQELDKFVDAIKAEDPETAMANGVMPLDYSDGSGAGDDMLGADIQGAYSYDQHNQFDQHGGSHHAALLHNMVNSEGGMGAHMLLDPSSMQVDYGPGSISGSEEPPSIASTLAHSRMVSAAAYHPQQQEHFTSSNDVDMEISARYSDRIHSTGSHGAAEHVSAVSSAGISPIPSGIGDAIASTGMQQNGGADNNSTADHPVDNRPTSPQPPMTA
ncbi:serine/threonine-protein phosphatase 2A 56 kDa regulatory subunit delta isoform [Coemansia guatemalensis]|uniref:Serine/threonine-protein phosphatase 2A 56 kDa regulatory subunit delta isoform n=1 Tax=Coemansia guatemalensis TaxID=2761395 RepID=A0A9W8I241_9FUNG|nr:serine/threonine-protein phosphatase 2A 56 kDa regulatory subunit delta isoform [Coemansia guatemalensis]